MQQQAVAWAAASSQANGSIEGSLRFRHRFAPRSYVDGRDPAPSQRKERVDRDGGIECDTRGIGVAATIELQAVQVGFKRRQR